jgi:RNA polymerase sigma-70 factor (ECF subfamily)
VAAIRRASRNVSNQKPVVTAADNRISDEALVSAMAAGDEDALATLNQRYGRALSAVAGRILRDEADAEEVAADVLWQLWRDASRFDRGRGSVGAWIMMTVRSRAIDRLRARNARKPRDADATEAAAVADPSNEIHCAERRRAVEAALASLNDGERDLLRMAYFSDLSQSEIAERTSIPLGTVKSRMRSGLIRLRDALQRSVD